MLTSTPKLVILDRDGTINKESDQFIKTVDEWEPLPGALEAIARLSQAGYQVVIATNQSGLGRGLFDMVALNAIHDKMNQMLAQVNGRVEAIFFCPHVACELCRCRKPRPGLFEQIAERFRVDLQGVPAVGDSLRDLQAAATAGAVPCLVLTGNGAKTQENTDIPEGTLVYEDLANFVDRWLAGDPLDVIEPDQLETQFLDETQKA